MTDGHAAGTPEIPPTGTNHLIPEFNVAQLDNGRYQAIALYEITRLRAEYGCKGVIEAETIEDLEVLCRAERIKVRFIDDAGQDPRTEIQRATAARYRAGANLRPYVPPRP